jgi:EmrB/QacA subfamily drug resistance transporter
MADVREATANPAAAEAPLVGATPASRPASVALSPLGLVTLLVGVFLPVTDFFIVNVALPTIDHDLRASAGMLQLVVAGYAIAYAVLLVVGGRLGDALGRRRLFLIGMVAFTLTSLACGLAPNVEFLVAFRALQGAAAALMLPQVLSTIQATTSGDLRNRALGMYGAVGGVASAAGQLLGGLLVSADIAGSQWRSIFLVNVPVGIVGFFVARRVVPDSRSDDPAPVDTRGTLLLAFTLLAVLVPLTEGRSLGWPWWTIVLLVLSPLGAAAFVRIEKRVERGGRMPLVPFSLLDAPSMRKGLLVGLPFFTGFGGFMFVYALTLQNGAHLSALRTGVILLPMALGFLGASLSTARLLARFGRRVLVAGGLVQALGLVGIALALLQTWPHPNGFLLIPGMLVVGAGQGMLMSPIFGVVLSDVPAHLAGAGSGVTATMQQGSLALGVATVGSVFLTLTAHVGALDAAVWILGALFFVALLVSGLARRLLTAPAPAPTPTSAPATVPRSAAAPTLLPTRAPAATSSTSSTSSTTTTLPSVMPATTRHSVVATTPSSDD